MKYPIWKPILIILVFALFALILDSYPLRKGLDLAGGTTLVYDVKLPADAENPAGMIDDMINVLRNRIDPGGIRNLQWRRIAGNRIEIQMALAGDEVKQLRQAYVDARDKLLISNLAPRDVDAALRLEGDQRSERLAQLAGENKDLLQQLKDLALASDALTAARDPYQQLQEKLNAAAADDPQRPALQAQVIEAAKAVNEARKLFDQLRDSVLTSNITPNELQRVIDQPNTSDIPTQPSKRQVAADELKQKHPDRSADIDAVLAAYAAYEQKKGPLDDPNDLIAMLRGSGVLEFRIAATPDRPANVAEYREQLRQEGPRSGAGQPWRWYMVDDPAQFADKPSEKKALAENPEQFFLGRDLIGQAYADDYYVLLADTDNLAMTKRQEWKLRSATRTVDQMGKPAVAFETDARGAGLMGAVTGDNVGRPMAILLDGRVISAPNLRDKIRGQGIITGDFSVRELDYLLRTLKAGSTEAELGEYPISIKTTGPQLGQDNLKAGLEAAYVSLIAVAVFMLFYYFLAGAVADFALFANMVLILGVMAMFEATFTLPGIAGIVLTIGMAVDANVLIFERMREESEHGADLPTAVRQGYGKALSTIIDANLTTLITCVVLYYTATADIVGFAQTLMVGILATLFTSLFCTRVLIDLMMMYCRLRSLPMLPGVVPAIGKLLRPNINWLRLRYLFIPISAVFVICGAVVVYERGANMLDVEFRSGTQVSFRLDEGKTLPIDEVRQTLADFGKMGDQIRKGVDPAKLPADEKAVYEAMKPVVDRADERFANDQQEAKRLEEEGKKPGELATKPVEFALLADAVVVTEGESDAMHAAAFNVSTLITDSQAVSDTVKAAFAQYISASKPYEFADVQVNRVEAAPVYIVRGANLGDNIHRPDVHADVSEYLGGVAIVIDKLEPTADVKDITERIRRMRNQPAYEQLGYRLFTVIGLDLAGESDKGEPLYRSVAVVSRDAQTNYATTPDAFAESDGLADTEWHLVRDALTRDTSLASVSNFSASVSDTMKQQAIAAIVLSLLAVVVYIWFRFGSLRYGLTAIAALVHDVTIALGMVAASAWIYHFLGDNFLMIEPFKVNIAIVAAMLTIIGYSLNDTIIVFDRIRENRGRLSYATPAIINDSINQTISRTVLTSGTTMLALVVLYAVGGPGVHGFAFAMIVGIIVGTYSSIAIAAPLLLLHKWPQQYIDKATGKVETPQ